MDEYMQWKYDKKLSTKLELLNELAELRGELVVTKKSFLYYLCGFC